MSNNADTKLFTYDRLNDFVKNYKEYINNLITKSEGPDGNLYKYYHFEYSPNGINITDIGRIPSQLIISSPSNTPSATPSTGSIIKPEPSTNTWANNWTPFTTTNTVNAWKMSLSKTYNATKTNAQKSLNMKSIKPGLQFSIIQLTSNAYSTNYNSFQTNSKSFINSFSDPSSTVLVPPTIVTSMDTYVNAFQDPNKQLFPTFVSKQQLTFGCEWTGFFKPTSVGNYVFTMNANSGYFYVWIGDKSVCEYTPSNLDIYNGSQTFTINITEVKYYPIRIQFYEQITPQMSPLTFSLDIQFMNVDGTTTQIPTNNCLYAIYNSDGTNYVPPLLYCAFVSQSPADFLLGKFKCYRYDLDKTTPADLISFYAFLNKYKFSMQSQKYDMDNGGINIGFGKLPDNVKYTPVSGDVNSLPDRFSIYRLDTDLRMGNSYQVDTRIGGDALYSMRMMDPSLLNYAGSYNQLPDYFPENQDLTKYQPATNDDGEACKINCNNTQNCSHYYTYMSNGHPKCIIANATMPSPSFNQILPNNTPNNSIDAGSSSLFMRNLQLIDPSCSIVGNSTPGQGPPIANINTVNSVNVNDNSFPYSNYNLSTNTITTNAHLGVCGDASYNLYMNNAAQILYQNTTYNRDGTWINSPSEGFQTGSTPLAQTKYTDAINDTSDSIRAGLQNQQQYAQMMQQINSNYSNLAYTDIPAYLKTRSEMENNVNYDFSGNELLYFRNKPIPTTQQQNIIDNNQGAHTQNLQYVLGTLTAAALLVLALIIGQE